MFAFHISYLSAAPPRRVATTRMLPPPATIQHKRLAIWAHRDPMRKCYHRHIIKIQDTASPPLQQSIRCAIMHR